LINTRRATICGLLLMAVVGAASGTAQTVTPVPQSGVFARPIISELVERLENVRYIDQGDPGRSPGDLIVWGPNPLYDAENVLDTGATTQGLCIAINAGADCMLVETITFETGGTLDIRGMRPGEPVASEWTIVGGSGSFRGVTGTVTVSPTADPTIWARRFEFWI